MNFKTLAIFFAGAGLGVGGTWLYFKNKSERIIDEELEKINKELSNALGEAKSGDDPKESEPASQNKTENSIDIKLFKHELAKQAYDTYFNSSEEGGDEMPIHPTEPEDAPYLISANEYATDNAHEKITLIYYIQADVLCEEDDIIENPTDILGDSWKEYFNDDNGLVYVRNEKLGTDYEVYTDDSDADYVKNSLGFGDL